MSDKILAWHFLPNDGKTRDYTEYNASAHKPCKVKPGSVMVWAKRKPLNLCEGGLHASVNILDALNYAPGHIVCRVECSGEVVHGDDKLVCRRRRVLWMVDAKKTLHEFACWCADRVLEREKSAGREPDKRLFDAVRVKRLWVAGMATDKELAAARDAARDAARAATRGAAGYAALDSAVVAAWVAARAAAKDAAGFAAWDAAVVAAWVAKIDAARDAEIDAAGDAERKTQAQKLVKMIENERGEDS